MKTKNIGDRQHLLADIAEMYFIEGMNQAEIAQIIGVTRSNISRMLTEAKDLGIIQININRPLREDLGLAKKVIEQFSLINARIVNLDKPTLNLQVLAKAASDELLKLLKPGWVIGTSWGTAVSTTISEIKISPALNDLKVVQLLGALGARIADYDAHAIVRRLTKKLDAEGFYINAPFLVEDAKVSKSLLQNRSVQETLNQAKRADIALLGIGSSDSEHCSFYLADYVSTKEILEIQKAGAIGDVCGRFFDINGNMTAQKFQNRLIGISLRDLLTIPLRIGVAGGAAKIDPIIGALRGKLINILVSDAKTIAEVLKQTK